MTDQSKAPQPPTAPKVDFDTALGNAARILGFAEDELDLKRMERLVELGQVWINVGYLIDNREA